MDLRGVEYIPYAKAKILALLYLHGEELQELSNITDCL